MVQTTLNIANKQQLKNAWAFAVNSKGFIKSRRQLSDFTNCIITACSKDARVLGVRVGMRYYDAKTLIPTLKIFVIGGQNV